MYKISVDAQGFKTQDKDKLVVDLDSVQEDKPVAGSAGESRGGHRF